MADIALVPEHSGEYVGGGTSATWTNQGPGAGVAEGQIIVLVATTDSPHDLASVPAGCVQLGTTVTDGGGDSSTSAIAWRAGPSEAGLVTVEFAASESPAFAWCVLETVDDLTMLDVAVVTGTGTGTRRQLDITTATDGAALLMINGTDPSSGITMTWDPGVTPVLNADRTGQGHIDIGFRLQPTAGPTSMGGDWNTSDNASSLLIAFRPATGGAPADTTIDAPFLAAGTITYPPTVDNAVAQDLAAPFLPAQTQTYAPTVTNADEPEPDPTTIAAPFLPSAEQAYAPAVTNAPAQTITAPFLAPQTQLYAPTLTNAGIPDTTIVAPFLPAATATHAPILTTTRSPAAPHAHPRPIEETIILRGEGGQWMVVGQGAARGIVHEGLSLSADRGGPSTCSFTLKRDPGMSWPDLSPFNECIVEIGGVRVWSGRMREAPGQSGASNTISFTGSGWQSHLDDDLLAMGWVHSRLSDWRDLTTFPGLAGVATTPTGLTVTTEAGELLIGWPVDQTIKTATAVGVMLDLGEHRPGAIRVVAEVSMATANSWTTIFVRGHTQENPFAGTPLDYVAGFGSGGLTSGVRSVLAGTVAEARRYVSVFLFRPGGDFVATAEHVLRIHRLLVFSAAADEAGNESDLRASTVIRDVVASGRLPRLDQDTSRVLDTGLPIPDYWPQGFTSPRELMEPVNAFHDWSLGVDVDRRIFFEPPSDLPTVEIGEWSGAEFSDASAGSGEDVYSTVVVQAQDSAGQPLEVIRTAGTAVPELMAPVSLDAAIANASFETDTANWTLTRMARSNLSSGHGSWSIRYDAFTSAGLGGQAVTGILQLSPGVPHRLTFWGNGPAGGTSSITVTIAGAFSGDVEARATVHGTGSGAEYSVVWVPRGTVASLFVDCSTEAVPGGGTYVYLDNFRVQRLEVNAVDRHRFARAQRLPIGAPLTAATAEVIGDIWLRNHIRTALKGSVTVTGQGGVREVIGGAPVHPAHLLLRAGECIRHAGMADPDTGAWGRVGRIAAVSYTGGQATVEIDNERHAFEALVARYAALAGQVG